MLKLLATYLSGSVLVGLITIPATFIYTRLLQPADYGIAMFVISLINLLFYFCNLGMDQAFVRFFYENKYIKNTSLLILRCLSVTIIGFSLLLLLFLSLGHKICEVFEIPSSLIPALLTGVILFTLLRFFQLIPRLLEQPKPFIMVNGLKNMFSLLLFLTFYLVYSTNYLTFIYSQLMSMLVVVLWLAYHYKDEIFFIKKTNNPFFKNDEYKRIIIYGLPSFFSLNLNWFFANLDKYLILKWSNATELGIYTAAYELTAPMQLITATFTTAWVPRMVQMLTNTPFKSKKEFSIIFEKLSFILTLMFLLLVFLKDILILFVGSPFKGAVNIFPWLLFVPYFWALSEIVQAGIIKNKKTYWLVIFSLFTVGLNLLFCFLFIPKFGGVGAAISVAISYLGLFLIRLMISFHYYAFKIKKINFITQLLIMLFYVIYAGTKPHDTVCFIFVLTILFSLQKKWLLNGLQQILKKLQKKTILAQ